jgi:2,5-dihydroxypyridine 5,6-dioxygenase
MTSVEWRWIDTFAKHFKRCGLHQGEVVAVLSESQSRTELVETARLAAQSLGARVFDVVVPTPRSTQPVPIRSTGASQAIGGNPAVVRALSDSGLVIDCTVEGLLHAPELGEILGGGARVLMISNEHPDNFERIAFDHDLARRVEVGHRLLKSASEMRVTNDSGSNLTIALGGAATAGSTGVTSGPGSIAHWPGGLVIVFPAANSVNGTLVLQPGDMNLTFNRYLQTPITLTIENDYIVAIGGEGVDAELFRSYLSAFEGRDAFATSHVGWGMNEQARWDTLALYNHGDLWGTELRAFAGNFLYSTGANEHANRFTAGHFDLPMRTCTVSLVIDGALKTVVDHGQLCAELASEKLAGVKLASENSVNTKETQ